MYTYKDIGLSIDPKMLDAGTLNNWYSTWYNAMQPAATQAAQKWSPTTSRNMYGTQVQMNKGLQLPGGQTFRPQNPMGMAPADQMKWFTGGNVWNNGDPRRPNSEGMALRQSALAPTQNLSVGDQQMMPLTNIFRNMGRTPEDQRLKQFQDIVKAKLARMNSSGGILGSLVSPWSVLGAAGMFTGNPFLSAAGQGNKLG